MIVPSEQHALLRKLWDAGLSALECGQEIGLTGDPPDIREAVLRVVESAVAKPPAKARAPKGKNDNRRTNLPPRFSSAEPADKFEGEAEPQFKSDGFDGTPNEWDLQIPVEQRKKHNDLNATTCHWPVGDPRTPEFFFCGGVTYEEEVYCADHCRRAYQGHLHRRHDRRRAA